jgi:hypothetical protein
MMGVMMVIMVMVLFMLLVLLVLLVVAGRPTLGMRAPARAFGFAASHPKLGSRSRSASPPTETLGGFCVIGGGARPAWVCRRWRRSWASSFAGSRAVCRSAERDATASMPAYSKL